MYEIYVIKLPKTCTVRIIAFQSMNKANDICSLLNENLSGSCDKLFEIEVLNVNEDKDFQILL